MMYAILVLILLFLVSYVLARWLRLVLREGGQAASTALYVARGGRTPATLVAEARRALGNEHTDLVIAARDPDGSAHRYRQHLAANGDRAAEPLILALGLDISQGRVYIHAIEPGGDGGATECKRHHAFSAISDIEALSPPAAIAGDRYEGASALGLCVDGGGLRRHLLFVEPEWRIRASDLALRLRAMIHEGQRPVAPPVIIQ